MKVRLAQHLAAGERRLLGIELQVFSFPLEVLAARVGVALQVEVTHARLTKKLPDLKLLRRAPHPWAGAGGEGRAARRTRRAGGWHAGAGAPRVRCVCGALLAECVRRVCGVCAACVRRVFGGRGSAPRLVELRQRLRLLLFDVLRAVLVAGARCVRHLSALLVFYCPFLDGFTVVGGQRREGQCGGRRGGGRRGGGRRLRSSISSSSSSGV